MVGTTQGEVSLRLIGETLRQARMGMEPKTSVRALAAKVGIGHPQLSRIENGRLRPNTELLARIGKAAGMTDSEIGELLADASQVDGIKWIATKHIDPEVQMQALFSFERRAAMITSVLSMHVPGLLQIPAYTAAILRRSGLPEWKVEERVASRARRSEILIRRHNPTLLSAYIGEEVLHRPVGGPEVMSDQLYELLDWADPGRPNLEVRIIPRDIGWYPGMGSGYTRLDFGDAQRSIIALETLTSLQFQDEEVDLIEYRRGVDIVRDVAMSPEDSRVCIAQAASQYETAGSESVA